ncbi:MAG TPA: 5-deoxy-glucuronate isomerase [Dongiaceae bacterium]|nr:5-deoxy-glucuronate isomerase [Dongiaceae bacterium]
MANLLVKGKKPGADGLALSVTPESAGWKYVGFQVYRRAAGQELDWKIAGRESCLVLLSGNATASIDGKPPAAIGGRKSVFEGPGWSVYLPADARCVLKAATDIEVGVCTAPGGQRFPARIIAPDDVGFEERGKGTNRRLVYNILPDSAAAESLLVVEVVTPGGNWSSYPPHKHDRDALPEESFLEETYYHRLNPPQGFAFQRVYTDDRSIDQTMAVEDGDCVMVPRGYHPVGAPHGYDLYYLNVMAGPNRKWVFKNDPAHEWIVKAG